MRADHRRRLQGFSLIEVLVALAIAASVIGAFYQAGASALALRKRTGEAAELSLAAEALTNRLGAEIALIPSRTEGREGNIGWKMAIAPAGRLRLEGPGGKPLELPAENLLRISIDLFRKGSREPDRRIETLRLDPRAMP
jgi:prepilin-type N-terminal cleavage/methylation domain-containing protein